MTNKTTEALKLAEIEDLQDSVTKALKKAFQLGQTYWQQADSESFSQNKKADETQAKFYELEDETVAAIREALAEPEITTPDVCGEVCARAKLCYGCGKALDEANAKHEPLCEDEGCPHHGTPHICFSDPSVLDKPFACETGECPDKSLCAGACECLYKAEPVKQEPVFIPEFPEIFSLADIGYAQHEKPDGWDDGHFKTWQDLQVCTRNKMLWYKYAKELRKLLINLKPVKQEPVAWLNPHNQAVIDVRKKKQIGEGKGYPNFSIPLYAAPVERQWVDLTDDEMWDVFINKDWTGEPLQLMSAVIAAFTEKNK